MSRFPSSSVSTISLSSGGSSSSNVSPPSTMASVSGRGPPHRISKRKLAQPIRAPDSLGYADVEEEKHARRPRYFDLNRLKSGACQWSCENVKPGPVSTATKTNGTESEFDWLARIPLVNDRHARGGRLRVSSGSTYFPTAKDASFLSAGDSSTTVQPPDTPSSRPPKNTVLPMPAAYIPAGRRGSSATRALPASMKRSSSTSSATSNTGRRPSAIATALVRTTSSDDLGIPLQRRHLARAASPLPPPLLHVDSPTSPHYMDMEPGDDAGKEEDDPDEYQPRKRAARISPSDGAGAASGPKRRKPRAKSANKLNLPIADAATSTTPAAASGSGNDSDASAISTRSHGRPRKSRFAVETPDPSPTLFSFPADDHNMALDVPLTTASSHLTPDSTCNKKYKALPVPLSLSLSAASLKNTIPRLHSPLSQTFTGLQREEDGGKHAGLIIE